MSYYDWQWVEENPQTALEIINDLERDLTTLRSLAHDMADEMELHGGEQAFYSLARYRAARAKEGQP